PNSPPGCAEQNLPRVGHDRRRSARPLWILSGSSGVWHASARRHCAWTRPHCDDPGRGREFARSDPIPQDGAGRGFNGGCSYAGEPRAVKGVGDRDSRSEEMTLCNPILVIPTRERSELLPAGTATSACPPAIL